MASFRLKCRKCGGEFHRHFKNEEFDELQGSAGIPCYNCGFPRMVTMRSMKTVKDGFKPGFQRNIGKFAHSYGAYKKELRAMGLVEVGYEEMEAQEDGKTNYWTPELITKLNNDGAGISDNEADHMMSDGFND